MPNGTQANANHHANQSNPNKSHNANRDMCEAFQKWVNDRGINPGDAIAACEWLNRYHMDRYLLIDRRIFKQKLKLLMQDWQRVVASNQLNPNNAAYNSPSRKRF